MSYFTDEELAYMIGGSLPETKRPAPPMTQCKSARQTAEEMLKKALEFAYQGMKDSNTTDLYADSGYANFVEGKYYAYEDMASHLEMLIKEAKQNG